MISLTAPLLHSISGLILKVFIIHISSSEEKLVLQLVPLLMRPPPNDSVSTACEHHGSCCASCTLVKKEKIKEACVCVCVCVIEEWGHSAAVLNCN